MSRKNTILIAVLINAGLLIVLFASALKSSRSAPEVAAQPMVDAAKVLELPIKSENPVAPAEEVDQVLRQFAKAESQAAHSPAPALPQQPQSTTVVVETKPNFAQDLQAIALPDATSLVAPAPVATAPALTEVVVKKGDFLEKIARAHNTTVEEIMKLNHLTSSSLRIGQVLKISSDSKKKGQSSVKPSATPSNENSPKYYTVKNGDNPWTIAVKNHLKVEELLKLNNLNEEKARHLKPGDQLRIR